VTVELGAWVALLGGRWRNVWVVGAWLFHLGVLAVMAIVFPYQLSGVAFAPFFRLEGLAHRVGHGATDRSCDRASPARESSFDFASYGSRTVGQHERGL